MSTKKPKRQVKELKACSRAELIVLLAQQQKLVSDGVASKLPDKGEKIMKSIATIEQMIKDLPASPVEDLENTFNSLSLKPKHTIPAASIGDLVEMHPEPSSVPEVTMDDGNLPPTARPLVKKLFETTENPEYNRLRKEHLDLFVRGRRGAKLDVKAGFKGSVALGLEEAINLRDAWREQKQDKTGLIMGDENERTLKYEVTRGQEGEGEEQEYEEPEGAMIDLDDVSAEGEGRQTKTEGKQMKKRGGGGTKERRPSAGKVNKQQQQQQQQQPVWDVQEDIKDILDMIPQEYKQPR